MGPERLVDFGLHQAIQSLFFFHQLVEWIQANRAKVDKFDDAIKAKKEVK